LPFGVFPEQNRVTIEIADSVPEGSRIKRQVVLDLMADDEGRIISPLHINEVVGTFVLLLGSAASVARGGATPGKRLLKLRVQGGGCALCREARRLGPLLVLSLAELLVIVGGLQIAGPLAIGLAAVLVLGLVAYYVWPLLRWRGAMPYDRATGFRVTRG